MKAFCRLLLRVYIHFINLFSALLPDIPGCFQFRTLIYNSFGNNISYSAKICSGTKILGSGLSVGRGTFLNRNCYFDLTGEVEIGPDCEIGHGAVFITAKHGIGPSARRCGTVEPDSITVGQGAWIGADSRIMPGVRIGPGAIVGAGSVVTRPVPADTLVAGIPAREIRRLDQAGPEEEMVPGCRQARPHDTALGPT